MLISIPITVKANIICNDGTISKTCRDCHQGCCSHHGGCTNNPNSNPNSSNTGGTTYSNNYKANDSSPNTNDTVYSNNPSNNQINKDNSNNTNQNQAPVEPPKSNDNTLTKIIIDGQEFNTLDNLHYTTTKEKINIEAFTNDTKATYEIKNNNILIIGSNNITINVTAENGDIKTYNINIYRRRLSSDTGINVIINNEKVKFENYQSRIYVNPYVNTLDIDYTLSDKSAKVKVDKPDSLKDGDNPLTIKVTAEDKSEQIYNVTIHKYSKLENTIYTIIGFGIIGGIGCGIGYGIYYAIKKSQK